MDWFRPLFPVPNRTLTLVESAVDPTELNRNMAAHRTETWLEFTRPYPLA